VFLQETKCKEVWRKGIYKMWGTNEVEIRLKIMLEGSSRCGGVAVFVLVQLLMGIITVLLRGMEDRRAHTDHYC